MADNSPSHHLYLVTERPSKDGKARAVFTELAPLWTSDKGTISGTIPPGLTVSGRIVIMQAAQKKATGDAVDSYELSDK